MQLYMSNVERSTCVGLEPLACVQALLCYNHLCLISEKVRGRFLIK